MSASGFVPTATRALAPVAPLSIPPRAAPPPRPAVPWLASTVPVVGALGFWAVTGSAFALWFALLGPLIAVAGVADGWRTARRTRRAATAEGRAVRDRLGTEVDARHGAEREVLRARHPDAAGFLARRDQIWRPVAERAGTVVIGGGDVDADTRVSVSADAPPEDTALAEAARVLRDAPVTAPLGSGIAVVGPEALARPVVRALVLQLALAAPPGRLEVVPASGEEAWLAALPHTGRPAATRLVVGEAADGVEGGVFVTVARPGAPLPPHCGLVLTLVGIGRARAEVGAEAREVAVEQIGAVQAAAIAAELAERALTSLPGGYGDAEPLSLSSIWPNPRRRSRSALPVAIGSAGGRVVELDLVRDGPHAVVTGMTGAGKSELLVSWVVAMCAAYETSDVTFLLADFKGGTAFDALAVLPHVTGVISDLDARVARRAISSLRAEIRHREGVLARAGVRDVSEGEMPRLVIVVDEFAALRDAHPELEALFSDIAARGRALGMHLIVGTQRTSGAVRDGLLANCPLRIALRVADRLDSRAVIGVDDAAELPGGERTRGLAMIRRSSDARPERVRIALSAREDIAVAARAAGPAPRSPWLPELPERLPLAELDGTDDRAGGLVIGVADDPDGQQQPVWRLADGDRALLAVGGPGAGKTTLVHTVAAQLPVHARYWIGPDPEQAWDALSRWQDAAARGVTVLIDDLDLVLSRFPDEQARAALDALERIVRGAGGSGTRIVASAHRLSGAAGRVADLFPRRLILATASRADHVAAGGDAAGYGLCTVPGRGVIDSRAVQIALPPPVDPAPAPSAPVWEPPVGVSGVVARRALTPARQRWERSGTRLRAVDEHADPAASEPGSRVVIVGTPEQWMSRPRLLERARAGEGLVVDAGCERDLRMLTGARFVAPYVDPARGRGWLLVGDAPPQRVTIDPTAGS